MTKSDQRLTSTPIGRLHSIALCLLCLKKSTNDVKMLAMVKNKKKKIQIANAYQQCLETGLGVNATAPRVKIQDFIIS